MHRESACFAVVAVGQLRQRGVGPSRIQQRRNCTALDLITVIVARRLLSSRFPFFYFRLDVGVPSCPLAVFAAVRDTVVFCSIATCVFLGSCFVEVRELISLDPRDSGKLKIR